LRALLVVAALALGLATEAVAYSWDEPRLWVADLAVGLCFIATGALATQRLARRGAGTLLVATGVTWFLSNLSADLQYLYRGPLVHLLVAYAGVRPRTRLDSVAVVVAYIAACLAPVWRSDPVSVVLVLALVAVAARGFLTATGPARRERLTALQATAALAAVLVGAAIARTLVPAADVREPALLAFEAVLVGCAVWLYTRLLPPAVRVADLVVELGETRSGTLRDRLARVLGDPELAVGFWSPAASGYLDDAGRPLALPEPESGREATRVEREGRPFAVLVHDAAVLADPALVEAVASAARLEASNVALQAERRARAGELVASRRRLLVAADRERRALEARLRRGPEQRLMEVEGTLAALPATDEHVARARRQLTLTLDDLHGLARGLHPRDLVEGGLRGALGSLAEHAPVPVERDVRVERLPEEFEATLYFVCAEALANIAKYARATRAELTIVATDGHVSLTVADDGIGGADRARGTGLQGLADRVETLGGTLNLASPPGQGTRLTVHIPL
jgi:signal transduction histidine kinase